MTFSVNVYSVGRAYGGPEEGGWWYNRGEFRGCEGRYANEEDAIARRDEVAERLERVDQRNLQGHGDWDGCGPSGEPDDAYICRGGTWGDTKIEVYVEEHTGADFPDRTPHYE